MVLVRVWRRQLLGGTGTAIIVPATLLASLAVLALAGSFGGLAALGQVLPGPSAPAPAPAGDRGGRAARAVPTAIAAALSARAAAPRTPAGPGSGAAGGGMTTGPGQPAVAGPSKRGPGGPAGAPGGGRTPAPSLAPKPQPTVVDKVVNAGTSVTSQLPGPGGSAATRALEQAGSSLDSIVPIKSP